MTARFAISVRSRAPYPGELPGLERVRAMLAEAGAPLLVVPFVSEILGAKLTAEGWSWADDAGNFDLRDAGLLLHQRRTTTPPAKTRTTLPSGSGSLAIIRALINSDHAQEPVSATALASGAGLSQARASQVLGQLGDLGLAERTPQRRWAPDREALLDRFIAEYSGPGGSERHFYTLDEPMTFATRVASSDQGPLVAVSADVGPDLLAAWRRPTVTVLYTRRSLDTDALGLVGALGRHDGNVIIRSPHDRSVFPNPPLVAAVNDVSVQLVDPTQQLWDLHDLGGVDRLEGAGRLHQWLLRRR